MSSVIINSPAKVVSVIEPDGPDEIIQGFEPVICLNVDAVFVGIGIIQSEEGLRKLVITERVKCRFCHKGTKSSVILLIFPFHEGTDKTILEGKTNTVFIAEGFDLISADRLEKLDEVIYRIPLIHINVIGH